MPWPVLPLHEKLWSRVQKTDTCWLWTGATFKGGYGRFKHQGELMKAHHVSYTLTFGAIPPTLTVRHTCGQPGCVNPAHLVLAPPTRVTTHGHEYRGEQIRTARLTEDQVREIRRRYAQGDISQLKLAREYGVTHTAIEAVVRRRTWKHVDADTS